MPTPRSGAGHWARCPLIAADTARSGAVRSGDTGPLLFASQLGAYRFDIVVAWSLPSPAFAEPVAGVRAGRGRDGQLVQHILVHPDLEVDQVEAIAELVHLVDDAFLVLA
jgi:hypothetical protein